MALIVMRSKRDSNPEPPRPTFQLSSHVVALLPGMLVFVVLLELVEGLQVLEAKRAQEALLDLARRRLLLLKRARIEASSHDGREPSPILVSHSRREESGPLLVPPSACRSSKTQRLVWTSGFWFFFCAPHWPCCVISLTGGVSISIDSFNGRLKSFQDSRLSPSKAFPVAAPSPPIRQNWSFFFFGLGLSMRLDF